MRNSDTLPTREYYFDEGLGESLAEHVDSLKKQFEDVTVTTRRDKDGFAIVTLKKEHQFKYKLEDLENADPEEMQRIQRGHHINSRRDRSAAILVAAKATNAASGGITKGQNQCAP